ncbi:hypothetical protein AVEN_95874-1 [Araneus ventricosus]|uniref:THAP-type domain-containing protein n=1 Tax=Araneus ventricosus TaxID=182803 RepID=A0A4Y2WHX2_ARAVE|nr:hypothetical protein AVEN_95874-1 [Araneus ventricosus]
MRYCCVIGCSNAKAKTDCRDKTFFTFPLKNSQLLQLWLKNIGRQGFMPSCSSLICSDHFEENSYSTCQFTKRRLLKQEAVPIIFSKTPKQTPKVGLPSSATDGNNMQPDGTKHGMHSVSSQTETFTDVSDRMNKLKDELKELQDSLGKKAFIPENISNDTQMKALTGFTKERFSCVYSFLNVEEDLQTGNFCKRPVDIFFLFLVKLRTGISNEFLSVLFEISDSTVSRYFTFVTTVLYEKLKLLHIFPSKSKVVESMPRQFYSENRDCRVIVDCTEFPIQKPNSPAEQQMTFSFYKNTNTLKGMIGIMPSGTISFISPLYCGSISDKELFIKSQLMDLLEPNDVVMADKGFQIEQELQKISCKLKCPKFLKDCIQFDASDRIENCKISNVRVTVERAISRIKIYKYFEGPIPYTSLHNINSIFFITCMLCNFHNPLINVK